MKFAAWRKVLSIFLLAVFLCAVPSLLTACSRTPGSDSTELDYATSRYFQALYRIVNKTFHPAVLEEFHQIADALASCVAAHEDYFTAYPDAKAAYGLMVQIPDILEQNLEPNADGNYVLRELPEEWLFCIFELWHYVYPGVYGAEHSTENCMPTEISRSRVVSHLKSAGTADEGSCGSPLPVPMCFWHEKAKSVVAIAATA